MTRRVLHAVIFVAMTVGVFFVALGLAGGHYAELWRPVP